MSTLLTDIVRRTRQHHAIEHATIHVLGKRFPRQSFSGYSDPLGFTILGEVTETELREAVGDALLRLQAGETQLAIHPNCGTNLATSAFLATGAAFLASSGKRGLFEKFTIGLVMVLAALIVAKPLGLHLQSYTTLAAVADRWVIEIRPVQIGPLAAYRVFFE